MRTVPENVLGLARPWIRAATFTTAQINVLLNSISAVRNSTQVYFSIIFFYLSRIFRQYVLEQRAAKHCLTSFLLILGPTKSNNSGSGLRATLVNTSFHTALKYPSAADNNNQTRICGIK